MTLRIKTLLIIGATIISVVAVLYFTASAVLMDGFIGIEEEFVDRDVKRSLDSLDDDLTDLENITRDWAYWDDTYLFMEDRNEEFVKSNLELDTSFVNNQLNLMLFVNTAGQVVFAKAFDLEEKKEVPVAEDLLAQLAADKILLQRPEEAIEGMKGIVLLSDAPMLISTQPILTSEGKGPPHGILLWGRYLDDAQIERLSRITHLSISMYRLEASDLPPDFREARPALTGDKPVYIKALDSETVAGYSLLNDISGEPALMLRVDVPRTIYAQGQTTMLYLFGIILAVGVIFGLLSIWLLEVLVLSRISRISDDVAGIGASGEHSARVRISGNDELSRMSGGINKMLDAFEITQRELRDAHAELETRVQERTVELQEKVAVLETLAEIDREMIGTTDSQSILDLVCRRAAELLRAPKSLIVIMDTGDHGRVAASHGMEDDMFVNAKIIRWLQEGHLSLDDLPRSGSFAIDAINETEQHLTELRACEDINSLVLAPLVAEGKLLGTLLVFDTIPRAWKTDEKQVLGLLSGQVALALEEAWLFNEEQTRREELSALYDLSRALADAPPDEDIILNLVTRHAVDTIHVTFARLAIVEDDEFVVRAAYPVRALNRDLGLGHNEPLKEQKYCQRVLAQDAPAVVHVDEAGLSQYEQETLFLGVAQILCLVPLKAADKAEGLLMLGEARKEEREPFSSEKLRLARSIADQTVSALKRAELFIQLEQSYLATVLSLASAVEAKDTYTADHAESLATMALAIARELGMTDKELEDLHYGAILHDVGKIGVTDSILQNPGKLSTKEWQKMEQHPEIGARILTPVPRLSGAAEIVRHHHERYDGSGYPDALAGENIPLGARILTVIDSYSAIVDKRVYKEARSHEFAVEELKRCAGTQFDPRIVEVFLDLIARGEIKTETRAD